MYEKYITVQRASSVYKALPGLWHTISTQPRKSRRGKPVRESVTAIITRTKPTGDWKTIEHAKQHHLLQVRDTESLRRWIRHEYQTIFGINHSIPSENFLIADINSAEIQIFPRVFRCPVCHSLTFIRNDREIGNEVNQRNPEPSKTGITCQNPNCNYRPITQQPHILLDYDSGEQYNLPTKCQNNHSLVLKYSGSAVSILGWRLACINKNCEYNKERDPYAKRNNQYPYFEGFYRNNKKLTISPSTRGPRQPIVITKVDTMRFPFKPNENLLVSLFGMHGSPSINELFDQWCKIQKSIIQQLSYLPEVHQRIKIAEQMNTNEKIYQDTEKNLLETDSEFNKISKKSDEAGRDFKKELIKIGISTDEIDSLLQNLRMSFDEMINLQIANGHTFEEFVESLLNSDPRKNELKRSIDGYTDNLSDLHFSTLKYLYHEESADPIKEPNRNLQIVKVGIGTKIGERNIPFHLIRNIRLDSLKDKNEVRTKPDETHPLAFGTNHPIEALFISIDSDFLIKKYNIEKRSNNSKLNLALNSNNEIEEEIEKMLHTLSHILIRRTSEISGLGLGSISHRIIPKAGSILLYTTVFPTLGQLREIFEYNITELVDSTKLKRKASECPRDPICLENKIDPANCYACLHIPDHCCDGYWNRNLDRRTLWNGDGSGIWN